MTSLGDIVERVLAETDWGVGNDELAREISERIPEEHLREALQDALISLIPMAKNRANRALVMRSPDRGVMHPVSQPEFRGESGDTYVSPKAAYFREKRHQFLDIGFRGVGRSVQFRNATVHEILSEALRLERQAMTTSARSQLFRKVAEEMQAAGVRSASELTVAAQEEFADRFRDIYMHGDDEG